MSQIENETFVKFFRKIEDWEWYTDANTFRLFFHLVLKANHKDTRWRGIEIKRGQRLTSLSSLASELNMGVQSVRTSINRLKSTGELTSKSTSRYTIIELKNYDKYQVANKQTNKQLTSDQQTTNKQLTTNKNVKNVNNVKNENNKEVAKKGTPPPKPKFIPPTVEDIKAYAKEKGYKVDAQKVFDFYDCNDWKDSRGNQVRNWKQKLLSVWFKPEHKIREDRVYTREEYQAMSLEEAQNLSFQEKMKFKVKAIEHYIHLFPKEFYNDL